MRTLSLAQQDFEEGGGTLETDGSAHRNLDIGVKRFRYFLRSVRDNMIITKKIQYNFSRTISMLQHLRPDQFFQGVGRRTTANHF